MHYVDKVALSAFSFQTMKSPIFSLFFLWQTDFPLSLQQKDKGDQQTPEMMWIEPGNDRSKETRQLQLFYFQFYSIFFLRFYDRRLQLQGISSRSLFCFIADVSLLLSQLLFSQYRKPFHLNYTLGCYGQRFQNPSEAVEHNLLLTKSLNRIGLVISVNFKPRFFKTSSTFLFTQ